MNFYDPKKIYGFYGVDNNRFKLDKKAFEAVEDPDDGYRSCLRDVVQVQLGNNIFFKRRLDDVAVWAVEDGYFEGFELVSVKDGHVWLRFGTDNIGDYYPGFVFDYYPRPPKPDKRKEPVEALRGLLFSESATLDQVNKGLVMARDELKRLRDGGWGSADPQVITFIESLLP